eukprot:7351526-Pyramimonas_sp.AAC.1
MVTDLLPLEVDGATVHAHALRQLAHNPTRTRQEDAIDARDGLAALAVMHGCGVRSSVDAPSAAA